MIVVRLLKLVLDQHRFPGQLIFADDIAAIAADKLFGLHIGQGQIQGISELFDIILGG